MTIHNVLSQDLLRKVIKDEENLKIISLEVKIFPRDITNMKPFDLGFR